MRYKVELHIKETGPLSKEDFRKLQDAVDAIASVTEFKMILDNQAMNTAAVAEMMALIPKENLGFKIIETDEDWSKSVYGH